MNFGKESALSLGPRGTFPEGPGTCPATLCKVYHLIDSYLYFVKQVLTVLAERA